MRSAYIYWSNFNNYRVGGGSIGRANKTGTGVDPSFVSGLTNPFGVAVDAAGPAPRPPTPDVQVPIPDTPFPVYQPGGGAGPPHFTSVQSSHDVWAPTARSTATDASTARFVARGTVFSFALDKASTVQIAVRRVSTGRRVGRTCKAPARRLRRTHRCQRLTTVATLRRTAHAGANQVPFTGRIRGTALTPGRYRAVFTGQAAGANAQAVSVGFRIVRP